MKITERRIRKGLAEVEKTKNQIAALRDKLREQVSEIESICETLDRATDCFDDGLRDMKEGIDEISQYL